MSKLRDRTAVVTGGGSGIGLAVAKLFLDDGANVVIVGRTEAKLADACRQLGTSDRLSYQAADVSDARQVEVLFQRLQKEHPVIDILVNNAGMNIKARLMRELTPEVWQKIVRTNLDGAFYCIHALLPRMLERRDGLIINVSSIAGKRASMLGGASYSAAKFGMSALGLCLAAEEKDSGIRVCNIYPGEVDTPILKDRPTPVSDEQRRKILRPEDVAAAVLFVATLPPHVSIPELVIKPTSQLYV
jgi:NADP-dependent 3-hydroxy acid dehydrogenase YdfG